MNFHILTLFPGMILDGLNTSITGRAIDKKIISINAIDIRDYSTNKHLKVDDYPYGGGAGMVMQAEPIYKAYSDLKDKLGDKKLRVVYLTPQGKVFNQQIAKELASEEDLAFLCGHYEGIDERILELIVTDYISIGDYVLTGGELPAMVMVDAISRLVPDVLSNDASAEFESFHDNLLEYPQYTRPEEYMGKKVPEVLLSGHHSKIDEWRRRQALLRTLERRPDLLNDANLSEKDKKYLQIIRSHDKLN
ncbi:MAG: tRNA (guanosine(37)-N1)-methyltransferase TrmD [Clostridiales bacterium]|nr:tRNA (guanosine(37)-N1)-methyltransferase TrmD [Clostridiales bacterium]